MFEFENGWKPLERSLRPTRCQTSKLPISKLDPYHHFFIKLFWRRFSWSQFFGYLYLGIIAGHVSLDICIWVFCGSHFFEYLYLGIFVGHNSLDICIWVQFFGYFYLAIFAGHISLDICIWVFLWVTNLWIFVFGYFCESYFLGICDLVFLRVIFVKAVQWASSSPRCHFQQVGKHL